MQIKKFKPTDHKIKALIYGAAGSGKTCFAGTAKNVIFASAEGGLLSIAEKSPDFVEIKTLKDLSDLYYYLLQEKHQYETVVIDSMTEINEMIKTDIERRTGRSIEKELWDEVGKKIRDFFRKFRDLPMNFLAIAHESYITDKDAIKKVVPSLNGKSATEVARYVDIVGYIHVENDGSRWIETSSNKKLLTRDRSKMIGNDTPMDFEVWLKKVSKIPTGEQVVAADYSKPEETRTSSSPTGMKTAIQTPPTPHLDSLKKELKNRGATNAESAIQILNEATQSNYTDLKFSEKDASGILIKLLQVKKTEVPKTAISPSHYTDFEKTKNLINDLNTEMEIEGLLRDLETVFDNGEITQSSLEELVNLCGFKLQEVKGSKSFKKIKKTKKVTH